MKRHSISIVIAIFIALVIGVLNVTGQQTATGRSYPVGAVPVATVTKNTNGCSVFGGASSVSTLSCTPTTSPIPAGSSVFCQAVIYAGSRVLSVTDSHSDTFTAFPNSQYAPAITLAPRIENFYFINLPAAITGVTVNWTGGGTTFGSLVCSVANGLSVNQVADTSCTGSTSSSGTVTCSSMTTLQPDYIFCGGASASSGTLAAGSGFTLGANNGGNLAAQYQLQAAAATLSPTMTGVNSDGALVCSAFYPSPYLGSSYNGRNYSVSGATNGRSYVTSFDLFMNFEGGTSTVEPTNATLQASTFADYAAGTISYFLIPTAPALVYGTAAQMANLPNSVQVQNNIYSGSGSLGLICTTSGTGTSCPDFTLGFTQTTTSVALGFTLEWSCPENASQDCGNLGGIGAGSINDWASIHVGGGSGALQGKMHLETSVTDTNSGVTVSPNTIYRVNIQYNKGSSATAYATVCNAQGQVIGTLSEAESATAYNPTGIIFAIQGEEPATSGYTYYWDNYVLDLTGLKFSTTGCF